MPEEKLTRHVELVIRSRVLAGRERVTNRARVDLGSFKVTLKDDYKGL